MTQSPNRLESYLLTKVAGSARRVRPDRDFSPSVFSSPMSLSRRKRSLQKLFEAYGSPFAVAYWQLIEKEKWEEIASVKMPDPHDYHTAHSFHVDYQAWCLLRKSSGIIPVEPTVAGAVRSLEMSERRCAQTNRAIRLARKGELTLAPLESILHAIKGKISRLLGDFDKSEFFDNCGWGPGSTASLPRRRSSRADKVLEKDLSVTPLALDLAKVALSEDIHWLKARGCPFDSCSTVQSFALLDGCKGAVVEKDFRSRRFIAIEPTMNLFLQKGIGSMLRSRLRRAGVDLEDQSKNRNLARIGSRYGSLATIDLSSASDTVSRDLVRAVLPEDWLSFMDRLRSPVLSFEGKTYQLEKYSSMGNGFTFELETLIFWAICKLSGSSTVSVYGDDIVVDTDAAERVTELLTWCGFQTNKEKSFMSGPFRESCGGHYFNGVDVTPVFIRDDPCSHLAAFFRFANRLFEACEIVQNFGPWIKATGEYDFKFLTPSSSEARDRGLAVPYHWCLTSVCQKPFRVSTKTLFGYLCYGVSLREVSQRHPNLDEAHYAIALRFGGEGLGDLTLAWKQEYAITRTLHWATLS